MVYFHRFYLKHSFTQFDRHLVAVTCLFLASKVEETQKKLREIAWVYVRCIPARKRKFDIPVRADEYYSTTHYKYTKQKLVSLEKTLLRAIAFQLKVVHPYTSLLDYARKVEGDKHLTQVAWNFVNDSLHRTDLCLQYAPDLIACASIYLASKYLKKNLFCDGKSEWWAHFKVSKATLEEISNQILDLYERDKNNGRHNSPEDSNKSPTTPTNQLNQHTCNPNSNKRRRSQKREYPNTSADHKRQRVGKVSSSHISRN